MQALTLTLTLGPWACNPNPSHALARTVIPSPKPGCSDHKISTLSMRSVSGRVHDPKIDRGFTKQVYSGRLALAPLAVSSFFELGK